MVTPSNPPSSSRLNYRPKGPFSPHSSPRWIREIEGCTLLWITVFLSRPRATLDCRYAVSSFLGRREERSGAPSEGKRVDRRRRSPTVAKSTAKRVHHFVVRLYQSRGSSACLSLRCCFSSTATMNVRAGAVGLDSQNNVDRK